MRPRRRRHARSASSTRPALGLCARRRMRFLERNEGGPVGKALIAIAVALTAAVPVRAAEIHVLSAAVMQTVFKDAAAEFERASGHKLVFDYRTMGAITERVLKGDSAELVIGSTASLTRLVAEGKIDPRS